MSERPLLECAGITRTYGAVRALRGASLSVREHSVHGLVGHNGAGKSTLMKIIVGLVERESGTIRFDGEDVESDARRDAIARGIWCVPQELTLLPGMTVADNVCVGDEPRKGLRVDWKEMRARADRTLGRLGLDLAADAYVEDLKPSQQRMVMIATAVGRDCRLLILDEPTASLGTDEAGPLLDLIESLPGRGITVLYVSHRLDEVTRLCDRVTIMRDGLDVDTLERGAFDTDALVERMVGELPDRPAREVKTSELPVAVRLCGVHGVALRGVDAEIRRGVVTGFAGLQGSGADEVLELIAGARRPTTGTIEIDGRPVRLASTAAALRAGVGYVAGTRAQAALTELSVRENVLASSLGSVSHGGLLVGGSERRAARRWTERFGLADRIQRRLADLSGGNQQKVLMGRLLAADSQVLVINDPTAGVDFRARADLHELLREAADRGLAVVVRCSEPEELVDLADRVYVLAGGRVARTFDASDLKLDALLKASASSGADLGRAA